MVEEEVDRCHLRNWKEYGGDAAVWGNWMGPLSSSGVLASRKYLVIGGDRVCGGGSHHGGRGLTLVR